ncbi:MAG TPA: glycoside hydrolase family 15 protein, partial [Pyrinomonadaceae bacterium]|nr:glycoside hydrolase family 15 protein [Pyrinomonadaceae bacterium]
MKVAKLRGVMILLSFAFVAAEARALAEDRLAPGAPGKDAEWSSAGKQAAGTANSLASKVWFTLQGGALTEVFYPTADIANVHFLEFVVVNPSRKTVETEREDTNSRVEMLNPHALTFRQINTAKNGEWKIIKTYTTDPQRNTVLIAVQFQSKNSRLQLYVYFDPSLNNSGMHDSAWSDGDALMASDADKFSALLASGGFSETTNGFYGASDGLGDLRENGRISVSYTRAENGNVAQLARVRNPRRLTLALGFGSTASEALDAARGSLTKGFRACGREYQTGWLDVIHSLPRVDVKYQDQFNVAVLVLKALEDKTFRGATIASPSAPWIHGPAANEPYVGGYHLVWARDLYHVATAYLALGDKAAAERALNYLFRVQQRSDGSFPQISWIDGKPVGDAVQMDEVSYPLILAYQLRRYDRETYQKHVQPAADYIVRNGPVTQQERWEEKRGYSPATI